MSNYRFVDLKEIYGDGAHEGAEDHDTVESDVDDTGALGEHARHGDDQKRRRVNESFLQKKDHLSSPPSSFASSNAAATARSVSFSFFFAEIFFTMPFKNMAKPAK